MVYNYITTNLINNKQYIGSHTTTKNKDDNYLGSGKLLLKAFKKYTKKNFKKEILCICDTLEDSFINEEKFIKEFNTLDPNGYNLSPTGGMHLFGKHSEATKQKMRKPKGKISETHRENLSKSHMGHTPGNKGKKMKPLSEEHKNKVSTSLKGRTPWNKGKKTSEETKSKISKGLMGRSVSEGTRIKISNSNKLTKSKDKNAHI